MSSHVPITVRFSNLLQTNPQSCLYGLDLSLSTSCNLQNGNILFQRIRRKSVNVQSLRNKKSPDRNNGAVSQQISVGKNLESIVTKDKINRLLLQANFQREIQASKSKHKKMYVIRKREEKNKSDKISEQGRVRATVTRSITQPIQQMGQTEGQQLFKIKRKVPKFGLQDMVPRSGSRKNSLLSNRCNMFLQTSSNTFYSNSFMSNNKPKQKQYSSFIQPQSQTVAQPVVVSHTMMPQIKNISYLTSMKNANFLQQRRKQRQLRQRKFFNTNNSGFVFTRSKTEDIQINVCGWQHQEGLAEEEEYMTDQFR